MDTLERIRHISAGEFAAFGVQDVAYIKGVVVDGAPSFAVHAADGTQIAVIADRQIADAAVRQHDMEPVSVH